MIHHFHLKTTPVQDANDNDDDDVDGDDNHQLHFMQSHFNLFHFELNMKPLEQIATIFFGGRYWSMLVEEEARPEVDCAESESKPPLSLFP